MRSTAAMIEHTQNVNGRPWPRILNGLGLTLGCIARLNAMGSRRATAGHTRAEQTF
jgi:hypothetical protein